MSQFSRRIGSKGGGSRVGAGAPGGPQPTPASASDGPYSGLSTHPLALYLTPLLFVPSLMSAVFGSLFFETDARLFGLITGLILTGVSGYVMRKGLQNERDYNARTFSKAPPPLKTLAHGIFGSALLLLSLLAADNSLLLTVLMVALGVGGSWLAYGGDPRSEKTVSQELADRAGVRREQIVEAIEEARGKIDEIDAAARRMHGVELKQRLQRISDSAQRILQQIEQDPSDIRRARRFLVTYLDGTRDVVTKYGERQQDLATTPLGDSFRQVLETVERVFAEQEDVLKRNETLDLEVQIEVLNTQLEKEGVH